jgi:hypothetical protein
MTRTSSTARWVSTAAVSLCLLAATTVPAAARPTIGETTSVSGASSPGSQCDLERIGTQMVRCDNLTGAGVAAPWWLPTSDLTKR